MSNGIDKFLKDTDDEHLDDPMNLLLMAYRKMIDSPECRPL